MIKPVYDKNRVTLFYEDCLNVFPEMPDGCVDSVIADPPYGVNAASWDEAVPTAAVLQHCLRIAKGPVLWFGAATVEAMKAILRHNPPPDRCLVWHVSFTLAKTAANGMFYHWHPIWVWRPTVDPKSIHSDVITVAQTGHNWWNHPATKPVKLMSRLVRAFGGDTVLDPYMGSGTTGVACVLDGKRFVGVEREAGYVEVARKRIVPLAEAVAEGRPTWSAKVKAGA